MLRAACRVRGSTAYDSCRPRTGLLLAALVYAGLNDAGHLVDVLGPLQGILFLVLLAGIAGRRHGWWTWGFFALVVVIGPFASIPGLEARRRRASQR